MSNLRKMAENSKIKTEAAFPRATAEKRIVYGRNMSECTSFRAGGPADIFALPSSIEELKEFLIFFLKNAVPVFILGAGSNVLFSDKGFRGAVVSTALLDNVSFEPAAPESGSEFRLRCEAGCPMDKAVDFSINEGFSGLEKFAGLPGSAGGAAFMNARCYGASVSDAFAGAEFLRFRISGGSVSATIEQKAFSAEEWGYKRSPFNQGEARAASCFGAFSPCQEDFCVLTSVLFRLERGERSVLLAEAAQCRRDREEKGHFRLPSAGSAFKNNRAFGKPTGAIIDEAGLRGMEEGGAMIAPWHGNIIVNKGGATASDIRRLMEKTAAIVLEKTGFALESEIVFAGEWDD